MRYIVRYLLAGCCLYTTVQAQPPVVTYVTKVALVIQSGIYVDTLVNDRLMHLLSERICIALAPRRVVTESDQYLVVSEPVKRSASNRMLFRAYINEGVKENWRVLPKQSPGLAQFPFDCLLVDTLLQPGDSLVLEFRFASSREIIQRCFFMRERIMPEIVQYRGKNANGRIEDSILSKALKRNGKMLEGFEKPLHKTLTTAAGDQLELLLKHHSLNIDSSVQYRLLYPNKTTDSNWKKSGHLLKLNNLPPNDSVLLEMRYEGMGLVSQYKITVLPFWYQRWWATVVFIFTGALVFIVLPVYGYKKRLRRKKENRKRNETQLKNAQSQLNPHFIFNALNSIDALVHAGENEKATAYLADFSDMMRNTLNSGDIVFTHLSEDIAMLEKYIRIEQLRFDFRYEIYTDPEINATAVEFPPMLLQPAVENAVKHGVAGMGNEGMLLLSFEKINEDLLVRIKDNGRKKTTAKTKGTGRGIVFTENRIRSLFNLYKHEISFRIKYLPGETQAIFYFKNWL